MVTDQGVVGWSEYNESYGSKGLTAVIRRLADPLIGQDPRPVERISAPRSAAPGKRSSGKIASFAQETDKLLGLSKNTKFTAFVCVVLGASAILAGIFFSYN